MYTYDFSSILSVNILSSSIFCYTLEKKRGLDMFPKNYWYFMIPSLIIAFILIYTLDAKYKLFVLVIPVLFWVIYYVWVGMQNKKKQNK